jgi:hypothetical protein
MKPIYRWRKVATAHESIQPPEKITPFPRIHPTHLTLPSGDAGAPFPTPTLTVFTLHVYIIKFNKIDFDLFWDTIRISALTLTW